MKNKNISLGALFACIAVLLGAFGAHTLKDLLTTEQLSTFETGVRYQMYHAIALIIVGILQKDNLSKNLKLAGKLFLLGIFIFSFSLYLLTALNIFEVNNMRWIGAITPIGGVCFIAGWFLIFKEYWKR